MLNLPEFEVIKKEVSEYYYRFTIVPKDRPFMCTQCMWDETPIMGDDKRFIIHRAKVLYGTTATKRPKFTKNMNMRTFYNVTDINRISRPLELELDGFEVDLNEFKLKL